MTEMASDPRDTAIDLMREQRYAEAYPIFCGLISETPSDGYLHYMAGQCARFLNDLPCAISHLNSAVQLDSNEPSFSFGLGIALQLAGKFDEAIEAFRVTLKLNPDLEPAYNSLALTQKKMGEFELALHNYEEGLRALTRRVVRSMRNSPDARIYNHRDTRGQLWAKYAVWGAMYICSASTEVASMALPTGEMAVQEEKLRTHRGLYWLDSTDGEGRATRLFLPNYFNTFRESLCSDTIYSNLIGNRGTVLELMAQHEDAQMHFAEAEEFMPRK
jgi:tetratricopeptide (TPR) repeat protein